MCRTTLVAMYRADTAILARQGASNRSMLAKSLAKDGFTACSNEVAASILVSSVNTHSPRLPRHVQARPQSIPSWRLELCAGPVLQTG